MAYATVEFYQDSYLLGRRPKLPLTEFSYWEQTARRFIDDYTFNKITEEILEGEYGEKIKQCVCELSEYLYVNEGNENKQSEGIPGRSASYRQGTEYFICRRHLGLTGLMHRGCEYVVSEGYSLDDGDSI